MKQRVLFTLFLLVLLISLDVPAPVESISTTVVRVNPSLIYLNPGQTAMVEILVDNVTDLYGFSVEIHFDPAKLTAGSLALGDFLEPGWPLLKSVDNVNGIVKYDMTQYRPSEPKTGSGVLVVFEIKLHEAVSETSLLIDSVLLTDRNGNLIPSDVAHGKVSTPGESPEFSVFLPLVLR